MALTEAPDWYQEHRAAIGEMARLRAELEKLSSAFQITGNHPLAERLSWMASELEDSYTTAETAVSKMIREEFDQSMSNIGKTLSVLADKT